jgi:hypothetical protein
MSHWKKTSYEPWLSCWDGRARDRLNGHDRRIAKVWSLCGRWNPYGGVTYTKFATSFCRHVIWLTVTDDGFAYPSHGAHDAGAGPQSLRKGGEDAVIRRPTE